MKVEWGGDRYTIGWSPCRRHAHDTLATKTSESKRASLWGGRAAVLESIVRAMSPRNRSKIPWPALESIVRARSPRNRPKLPYLSCLPNALARGAFVCPSDAVRWGCGMQECPKMRLQMLVYSCGKGGAEEKNESERKQREREEKVKK